jgi:hypothetical protein
MDDKEALELLDAHLDHEILTPEQAERLRAWLLEHPEHADQAFRRIVVHGFLRDGLQRPGLPAPSGGELRDEPNLESQLLRGELITIDVGDRAHLDKKRRWLSLPWLFAMSIAICLCGVASWFVFNAMLLPSKPADGLWAYEGFDYPPTSPPAPLGDGNKWPTSGGMQGLSGGSGWAGPWEETAAKVSILIADVQANAWRASDMRKFGPLGYSDAQGHVLKSTGIQLRTAAGPTSATLRLLDVAAFPANLSNEDGLGRDGAVLWMSFLAQSFDGRGLGNFSYVQLGTDSAGFRVGKLAAVPSGNWSACGILDGAEMNVRWSDTPSGQPILVVTRITFRPGDEEAEVWINPRLEVEPVTIAATLHVSVPNFRWNQLSIRSRYSTDFDEIRIGGGFRDVTPVR